MDLPIYLPTKKVFVQTFFLEKVWLEDTLPTYSLDICPKFRSFFLLDPLLSKRKYRVNTGGGGRGARAWVNDLN